MKRHTLTHLCGAAVIAASVALSPIARGQEAVTQTTTSTTSDGTVTEFSPDTVVIHTQTSEAPVRYSYTKTTTVVDDQGNPVDISIVKSGVPVQVFYDRDGDRMVARKIIVHRRIVHEDVPAQPAPPVIEHKETTTTTTTTNDR